jgi:hypothetical protein
MNFVSTVEQIAKYFGTVTVTRTKELPAAFEDRVVFDSPAQELNIHRAPDFVHGTSWAEALVVTDICKKRPNRLRNLN